MAGVLFNYQLNPAWCEFVFELVFTQLCRRQPDFWFHLPIGSAACAQVDVLIRGANSIARVK
jgi:hypothetical protein